MPTAAHRVRALFPKDAGTRAIQTDRCRPYLAHPSEAPVPPPPALGPLDLHDGA